MRDPRILLGILISIAASALLFYVVNPWEVLAALRQAQPGMVIASIALIVLAMLVKATRWRLFFPDPQAIRIRGLHEAVYIGYMVNTVLPLRTGEVVRAFLAAETERANRTTTLATVLIEKVIDLGTMALLLFLLGQIFPELPDSARYAAVVSGIGLLVAVGGIAFALLARGMATRLALWLEQRVPPLAKLGIAGLLGSFLDGLTFVRRPAVLVQVLFWTVVHWVLSAWSIAFALIAVGIEGASSYQLIQMTLLVMVATNLSMAIPSAPGYVGVFHGVFVATLAVFGIREEPATAAAVLEHAIVFGVFIVGGAYYLVRGDAMRISGRRLGDVVARARTAAPEAH